MTIVGWFRVDWWIWGNILITKIKDWNSVINNNRDWFASYVKFYLESTILWIFFVGEDFFNSFRISSS